MNRIRKNSNPINTHRKMDYQQERLLISSETRKIEHSIARNLNNSGYHVFNASIPSRKWFKQIYEYFDSTIKLLEEHPNLTKVWDSCAQDWLNKDDNRKIYCDAPPVFRDRTKKSNKRDKIYIQLCTEFLMSKEFLTSKLIQFDSISKLRKFIIELHFKCTPLFHRAFQSVMGDQKEKIQYFYPHKHFSPVVFKMIRYNYHPNWFATDPHYDKSALSLILDSDDEKVNIRVGKYHKHAKLSCLEKPTEYPIKENVPGNSTLITGLCLNKTGLSNLLPSPHCVLPVEKVNFRHSIVGFHLAPFLIDTELMQTQVDYQDDLNWGFE